MDADALEGRLLALQMTGSSMFPMHVHILHV